MPNAGIDVSTKHLAIYTRMDGRDDIAQLLEFRGDEPHERLKEVNAGIRQWVRTVAPYGRFRVAIEEPVIGGGARSSMLVGVFAGAAYGILAGLEYNCELVHPSVWRANLRRTVEDYPGIQTKEDVQNFLKEHHPSVADAIAQNVRKGAQPDMFDAAGIAYSA